MAGLIFQVLGDWLAGSGWTDALAQADVASSGTADSFLHATHVSKTRHAHQVTAATLYTLLQKAYEESCAVEAANSGSLLTLTEWCSDQQQANVQFDYWLKTLELEILLLLFVRSIREGNFELYVETLTQIAPWMFALDHTHYARWLSIHIRDMLTLRTRHPAIAAEFYSEQVW